MRPIHLVLTVIVILIELAVLARAILRPHREPASRLAWVIIIIFAPVVGTLAYMFLGETRMRRRRFGQRVDAALPRHPPAEAVVAELKRSPHGAPFALARTVNRVGPTAHNSASLAADSDSAIDGMAADVDSAQRHVHLPTYPAVQGPARRPWAPTLTEASPVISWRSSIWRNAPPGPTRA